jgi:hypothetical protein
MDKLVDALCSLIEDLTVEKDKLNRGDGARELALCITKLEEAEMWFNKAIFNISASGN